MSMQRTKGIGGIYFKSGNPSKLKAWYQNNLGVTGDFRWHEVLTKTPSSTEWDVIEMDSTLFSGTDRTLIICYIVDDLNSLFKAMKGEGVKTLGEPMDTQNGKTAFIFDPEGNKIMLRQPSALSQATHPTGPVTGLGGVFFKSPDPKKLNEWYARHLGIAITEWGASFQWIDPANPDAKVPASTAWSIFKQDTKYLDPSTSDFMCNYRVNNLVELLSTLERNGSKQAGEMQEFSYGKFGWVLDPDGNKIELWEPIDDGF